MIKSDTPEEIQGCVKRKKEATARVLDQIPLCTEGRVHRELPCTFLLLEIKRPVFHF